jgi:aerobic-type carbon monoxide dehydrogenase small subunit (CoxS/CutS family)
MRIRLTVNGRSHSLDVPEDAPLLWVLRDEVGLVGTKFGCGAAQCGACTVHVDGVATRSCVLPVSAVRGKKITTVEGLSPEGTHALQRAWEELDVPQCGYCQAGQLMSAAALLPKKPRPTAGELDARTTGTPCRSATSRRIRQALHRAPELQVEAPPTGKPARTSGGQP